MPPAPGNCWRLREPKVKFCCREIAAWPQYPLAIRHDGTIGERIDYLGGLECEGRDNRIGRHSVH